MAEENLDRIIIGRYAPHIYAFLTNTFPRYLKVGDTYRPVDVRLDEWRRDEYFPDLEEKFRKGAVVGDGDVYFRDISVHDYLIQKYGKNCRMTREVAKAQKNIKGREAYFSQEFFTDGQNGGESLVNDVKAAIDDIAANYGKKTGKYRFYSMEKIGRGNEKETDPDPIKLKLRPNQKEAVKKFMAAINADRRNLLMYAVMRFGKTVTSLKCAKDMGAKFTMVVSGKADVAREWRNTVLGFTELKECFVFVGQDELLDTKRIPQLLAAGKRVVLFTTLQKLVNPESKKELKQVFDREIDLLIIDETHFGARADEYGKAVWQPKAKKYEKADVDEETNGDVADSQLKEMMGKVLKAKTRLHLSGTPYRILMGDEFQKEDIVSFCQFTDILKAQKEWDVKNLPMGKEEWENPYFGFPQQIRFAFNLNEAARKRLQDLKRGGNTAGISELFKPQSVKIDPSPKKLHRKFLYEEEVVEFLKVIGGTKTDRAILSFLNDTRIQKGKMCRHLVWVLPWCASCDAMEALLTSRRLKGHLGKLAEYKILNISGAEVKKGFVRIADITKTIKECEEKDQKTITLTVNRMLTGSTVPEWDTMFFLRGTSSPQDYDQAIFRLQNSYVRTMTDGNGGEIKFNMKPQTLLVDFDPTRMFLLQRKRALYYNVNTETKGNEELERRIREELSCSPIITLNKDKIHEVEAADVINAVSEYSAKRGVAEETKEIPVDRESLTDPLIRAVIEKQAEFSAKEGLSLTPHNGEETDVDGPKEGGDTKGAGSKIPLPEEKKEQESLDKKCQTFHSRILFYSFLVKERVSSLSEIVSVMDKSVENRRIAAHLDLEKSVLQRYRERVNWRTLTELDDRILNLDRLANESDIDLGEEYRETPPEVKKAIVAMNKFGRLGESKIVTPAKIAYDMVRLIPPKELKKMIERGEKVLDIASKMGEFAIAVVRRATEKDVGLKPSDLKHSLLAIPMCGITYEFTRKVYELLGLDTDCIATPEEINSYKLLEVKKNGKIDYERIKNLLTQKKSFNKITMNDNVTSESKHMKIAAVIGNPPYQEKDGGAKASARPIYNYFVNAAKTVSSRYSTMIMPVRWYSGGKGLDEFRESMLWDVGIASFVDYVNPERVFPQTNLRSGVCYFMRDALYDNVASGTCVTNIDWNGTQTSSVRPMRYEGIDVFIRNEKAISIIKKVFAVTNHFLSEIVSARKPFGLATDFNKTSEFKDGIAGLKNPIKCIAKGYKEGYVEKKVIKVNAEWVDRWKVLIPSANNIGTELNDDNLNTTVVGPGVCCTETYFVVGAGLKATKSDNTRLADYLRTQFVRFLHSLVKSSHHVTADTFRFVPMQDFKQEWTDAKLYAKYGITKEEQKFIESMIKPME